MKILVTGGAGYIGSVVALQLFSAGHQVTVLDDLSTGHTEALEALPASVIREHGSVRNDAERLLAAGFDGVVHLAAKLLVPESVEKPQLYWDHNLGGSLVLLEAMRRTGTPRIVFSSTAAVYGQPELTPIEETCPPRPTNPYGATKLAVDIALREHAGLHGIGAVSLRYFNAGGASGRLGERHDPETHLIPNILKVPLGESDSVLIFGDDYPTPDGTCIRDYIHIEDLAHAHVLAMEGVQPGSHRIYNVGNGAGFSVREVVEVCRQVTGHPIPVRQAPRRAGDPAVLVASSQRIQAELGWKPAKPELRAIVGDAWSFAQHAHSSKKAG